MLGDFFRRSFQILAIAAVGTVIYLDILTVPAGNAVFLEPQGAAATGERVYPPGVYFMPTLFVPGRWRKYQVETGSRVQDIRIRLPLRYSAYLRLNDLFYVQIHLKVEGEIQANEAWVALKALQFRPVDRDKFIEEHLQFLAAEYFIDANTDETRLEKLKAELTQFFANSNLVELQKRLNTILRGTWYKLNRIELRALYVPDSQIYAAQTRNLGEVAAADRRALITQIEKEADLALERKRNLEDITKAEKMSALIAENPDLLEYYKIDKIAPRAGSVVLDASGNRGRRGEVVINQNPDKKSLRGKDGKAKNSDDSEADGGEIGRTENGPR